MDFLNNGVPDCKNLLPDATSTTCGAALRIHHAFSLFCRVAYDVRIIDIVSKPSLPDSRIATWCTVLFARFVTDINPQPPSYSSFPSGAPNGATIITNIIYAPPIQPPQPELHVSSSYWRLVA